MLEQEWGSVRVSVNLSEDLLVTGNTINFLYTIIRELIWNAEKYSGYNEEEPDFFIIIAVDENAGKIVFQVKNNVSNDVSRESVCNNIKEIEEIIQTVEKADVTV